MDVFWEGLDEVLNASLFVLIGLELVVIDLDWRILVVGVCAWVFVLIGCWAGVMTSLYPMHRRRGGLGAGTTRVMDGVGRTAGWYFIGTGIVHSRR